MSTCTIHVITASFDEMWRVYLVSELKALHPGADVRVGRGVFDDVFVWTSELGAASDLVMTVDADEDETCERLSYSRVSRNSFDVCVRAAEDLAEQVEDEMKKIKRSWQRRLRPLRWGALGIVVGLFR